MASSRDDCNLEFSDSSTCTCCRASAEPVIRRPLAPAATAATAPLAATVASCGGGGDVALSGAASERASAGDGTTADVVLVDAGPSGSTMRRAVDDFAVFDVFFAV